MKLYLPGGGTPPAYIGAALLGNAGEHFECVFPFSFLAEQAPEWRACRPVMLVDRFRL